MLERGVGRRGHARARAVAGAVAVVAEERSAAVDARLGRVRVARIAAPRGALRIDHRGAGLEPPHALGVGAGVVEVGAPLPDIARHVVQAVSVGRVAARGRRPHRPVEREVAARELALPDVAAPRLAGAGIDGLVAPHVDLAVEPAARGELPFGLGGQPLARPAAVGERVFVGDVHDGVVVLALDRARGALRMTPVRAGRPGPPVEVVVGGLVGRGRREDERAGLQHLVGRLGRAFGDLLLELLPVDRALGDGLVARRLGEGAELRVGDLGGVDPEAADLHAVLRRFVGAREGVGRAHDEGAAGDPHHARGARRGVGGRIGLRRYGWRRDRPCGQRGRTCGRRDRPCRRSGRTGECDGGGDEHQGVHGGELHGTECSVG